MKISIIIPCFNEENTIKIIVDKILEQKDIEKEIIIVDDGSIDNSKNIIENIKSTEVKAFYHLENLGKGRALRTGFKQATGDIILIQDADLEYNPKDYNKILQPFVKADADVVYGSRFLGGEYVRLHYFWHFIANKLLTLATNIFTNLNMTDMETGSKAFKKKCIEKIELQENSFGIEPELTIKLAKQKYIFYEVPISYRGRSYLEGKKITFKDALRAIYCIFKYSFFK